LRSRPANIVPAGLVRKLVYSFSLAGLLQKLPNLNRDQRIRRKLPALDAGRIAAGMKNPGQKRETEAPSDLIGTERVLKS
jgi:hypothetical protein